MFSVQYIFLSIMIVSGVPQEQVDSAQEAVDKSDFHVSILPLDYSYTDDDYDRIQKGNYSSA